MKLYKKLSVVMIAITALLQSCSSDDTPAKGQNPIDTVDFERGFFVVNEGNSSPLTSTISFVSDQGQVITDLIQKANPDLGPLGVYYQDLFFSEQYAFVISAGSNALLVFNKSDFTYVTTLTQHLENPRYGVVVDGYAYVSNFAGFMSLSDDFVTKINLNDFTSTRIAMGRTANKMTVSGSKIYISNGDYGVGNTITVLDTTTDQLSVIALDEAFTPESLVASGDKVWVLSSSVDATKVYAINAQTNTIENAYDYSVSEAKNLQIDGGYGYFTTGTTVHKFAMNAPEVYNQVVSYQSDSQWGAMYGFAVSNGVIYIADAGDFNSDSYIYLYQGATLLDQIRVGVGPNGFRFLR